MRGLRADCGNVAAECPRGREGDGETLTIATVVVVSIPGAGYKVGVAQT